MDNTSSLRQGGIGFQLGHLRPVADIAGHLQVIQFGRVGESPPLKVLGSRVEEKFVMYFFF